MENIISQIFFWSTGIGLSIFIAFFIHVRTKPLLKRLDKKLRISEENEYRVLRDLENMFKQINDNYKYLKNQMQKFQKDELRDNPGSDHKFGNIIIYRIPGTLESTFKESVEMNENIFRTSSELFQNNVEIDLKHKQSINRILAYVITLNNSFRYFTAPFIDERTRENIISLMKDFQTEYDKFSGMANEFEKNMKNR